jgi:uncharacterized membrane protein
MAKSKILWIALIASVAVNMSILGFVGAQWFRHSEEGSKNTGLAFDRRAALSTLEKSEKKEIQKVWRAHRADLKQNVREYRKAKRKLSNLLSNDPLNEAKIKETFDRIQRSRNNIELALFKALTDTAHLLPPKKRSDFFTFGFKRWESRHEKHREFMERHKENDS